MTNWKQQIDAELGNEQKFTSEIQTIILQKAKKGKKFNLVYPLTLVSACFIALILFLSWNGEVIEQQASSSSMLLNKLVEEQSVKTVYVSSMDYSDAHFFARPTILAFGMSTLNADDTLDLVNVLKAARLSNEPYSYRYGKQFIVKMENREQRKLVIDATNDGLNILDVETKLTYNVEGNYQYLLSKNRGISSYLPLLIIVSYLLISVSIKNRAPKTLSIFLMFLLLIFIEIMFLSINVVLSIWIPILYMLIRVVVRNARLKADGIEIKNLNLFTILLCIMWGGVFIWQLVGGII